jgi:esterase
MARPGEHTKAATSVMLFLGGTVALRTALSSSWTRPYCKPKTGWSIPVSYIPPKWSIPSDVKWIEINGYPMAYQDSGEGHPLVLVHGSFCDYRIWPDQIGPFSRKHRVLNISLRHYFPELWDGVGHDFSFAQHADDVGTFIQKLALGPVHLLGVSRGGAVVLEVAKKYPDLIRTLILVDASARLELAETEENLKATAFRLNLFADLRKDAAKGDVEGGTARFINRLIGPGSWESLPAERQKEFLQNIWTAIVDDPLLLTTDEELRNFNFPVLMLNGEKSPPMYGVLISEMRKRGNFEPPVIIPGAGHAMNAQNPKAFNEAVLKFTSEH